MKFKLLAFVALLGLLFSTTKVFALSLNEGKTYTNKNGIVLSEKEYQFVNDFYGSDFFDDMNEEDYDWISILDVNHKNVEISTVYDYNINHNGSNILEKGTIHSTNYKKLTIAKTCGNNTCQILTNLTWLINPSTRSYDVIGSRLSNVSLVSGTLSTKVTSSNGTQYFSNNMYYSNGFGTSVKLPEGASNIKVQQSFITSTGGTVYASYQHATSNVDLATSYLYTISSTGLGGVFSFYGSAYGKYDGMGGVDITL